MKLRLRFSFGLSGPCGRCWQGQWSK